MDGEKKLQRPVTLAEVTDAFCRGFLAPGTAPRKEDVQKIAELTALLPEVERAIPRRGGVVVDACAGKSALGVLAAALLERPVRVVAIEVDAARRAQCEQAAARLGVADRIEFVAADIERAALPEQPRLVVALHACGAATDRVIERSIAVGAERALLVPCCYGATSSSSGRGHDVPGQQLADVAAAALSFPSHALVQRKLAQAVIDAERTLRLEAAGYQTEVVEVFPPTLSPHGMLWRAVRVDEPTRTARAREQLEALRSVGVTPRRS